MGRIVFNLVSKRKKSKFDISKSEKLTIIGFNGLSIFIVLNFLSNYFELNIIEHPTIKILIYICILSLIIGLCFSFF